MAALACLALLLQSKYLRYLCIVCSLSLYHCKRVLFISREGEMRYIHHENVQDAVINILCFLKSFQ